MWATTTSGPTATSKKNLACPSTASPSSWIATAPLHGGHGDGLGPGDATYKVLKNVFTSPWGQTLFRTFHPDWGVKLARGWSKEAEPREHPMGKLEDEHLVQHAMSVLEDADAPSPDVFIFGHRHHPIHAPCPRAAQLPQPGRLADPHDLCGDSRRQGRTHRPQEGHPSLTFPQQKGLPMGSPFSCCRVQTQRRTTNLAAGSDRLAPCGPRSVLGPRSFTSKVN